jgi:transposase InsO family protein
VQLEADLERAVRDLETRQRQGRDLTHRARGRLVFASTVRDPAPKPLSSLRVELWDRDAPCRLVVGWAISPLNDRRLALRALDMAVRRRSPAPGLLLHTHQRSPYASEDYRRALEDLEAACSMSRRGNCLDNAAMESFFGTFKTELGESFELATHAENEVFDYVEVFYNGRRLHSSLGYLSPRDFEAQARAQALHEVTHRKSEGYP